MTSATPPPPGRPSEPPSGTDGDDGDQAAAAAWPQTPTDDPLDPEPAGRDEPDDREAGHDGAGDDGPGDDGPGDDGPGDDGAGEDGTDGDRFDEHEGEPSVPPVTTEAEGVTADLWAFRFDDAVMAQEALLAAMRLQRRNRLQLDDAAIVVRDERGRTRIVQTRELTTGQGALSGSWLGLLAGLFVPGGPLVGMALGAAAGGLFAKLRDKGINDDEMKQWGEQLANGQAALFLLVEDCHRMRALHEVSRFPATVLTSTGPDEVVAQVRERLPVDPWGP